MSFWESFVDFWLKNTFPKTAINEGLTATVVVRTKLKA
jgi:hypothetical protein